MIYGGTDLNENISNSQAKTIIDALTLGAAHRNPGFFSTNIWAFQLKSFQLLHLSTLLVSD